MKKFFYFSIVIVLFAFTSCTKHDVKNSESLSNEISEVSSWYSGQLIPDSNKYAFVNVNKPDWDKAVITRKGDSIFITTVVYAKNKTTRELYVTGNGGRYSGVVRQYNHRFIDTDSLVVGSFTINGRFIELGYFRAGKYTRISIAKNHTGNKISGINGIGQIRNLSTAEYEQDAAMATEEYYSPQGEFVDFSYESEVPFNWIVVQNVFDSWRVRSYDNAIAYNGGGSMGTVLYRIDHKYSEIQGTTTTYSRAPTSGRPLIPIAEIGWKEWFSYYEIADDYRFGTITVFGELTNFGMKFQEVTNYCTITVR